MTLFLFLDIYKHMIKLTDILFEIQARSGIKVGATVTSYKQKSPYYKFTINDPILGKIGWLMPKEQNKPLTSYYGVGFDGIKQDKYNKIIERLKQLNIPFEEDGKIIIPNYLKYFHINDPEGLLNSKDKLNEIKPIIGGNKLSLILTKSSLSDSDSGYYDIPELNLQTSPNWNAPVGTHEGGYQFLPNYNKLSLDIYDVPHDKLNKLKDYLIRRGAKIVDASTVLIIYHPDRYFNIIHK
jgi:hypothetical protein